ncbi:hypothetical protein Angca_001104, partial [Angiostrongylus cantonensis]
YPPIDGADEYELNVFCYQSEELTHNDNGYYKFVVGDFNARMESTNESEYKIGNFGLEERNENGNCPAGLFHAARVFHGNLFFQK